MGYLSRLSRPSGRRHGRKRSEVGRRILVRIVGYGGRSTGRSRDVVTLEPGGARSAKGSEFVSRGTMEEAEYARAIYPASTNTIRVLTMVDPDTNDAFPATALHRFGTSRSRPIDNLHAGGLSAPVDLDTGELGPAVLFPVKGRRRRDIVETHPDSGMPITGVSIPSWAAVLGQILSVATAVGDREAPVRRVGCRRHRRRVHDHRGERANRVRSTGTRAGVRPTRDPSIPCSSSCRARAPRARRPSNVDCLTTCAA